MMKKIKTVVIILAMATLSASVAKASLMVRWGNGAEDIVTANTANNTSVCGLSALSLSAYAVPAISSSYYPNYVAESATPLFYAATTGDRFQVYTGTPDYFYTRMQVGNGSIFLWTKDSFLNGGDSASVTLTGMSVNVNSISTVGHTTRFVISLGSAYYISAAFGENVQSLSDPSAVSWYAYNINDYQTIGSSVTLTDFSNLTSAGFYVKAETGAVGTNYAFKMYDFSVNAEVIPEPATVGMLGLGALVTMLLRRIRK